MQKRSIIALALTGILTTGASANEIFVGAQYEFIDNLVGESVSAYRLELGAEVAEGIVVDNRTYLFDIDAGDTDTLTEFGLTASAFVAEDISMFSRFSLGYHFDDEYALWGVEAGAKLQAADSLMGVLSYTFGNSLDSDEEIRYNKVYTGVEFAVNKKNTVGIGLSYTDDQVENTSYSIGWIRVL